MKKSPFFPRWVYILISVLFLLLTGTFLLFLYIELHGTDTIATFIWILFIILFGYLSVRFYKKKSATKTSSQNMIPLALILISFILEFGKYILQSEGIVVGGVGVITLIPAIIGIIKIWNGR